MSGRRHMTNLAAFCLAFALIHAIVQDVKVLKPFHVTPVNGTEAVEHEVAYLTSSNDSRIDVTQQYDDITAAICHPVLHRTPNLEYVIHFAMYHKKLGFDHIFMWYVPHIEALPFFDQLQALPFVTLTKYWESEKHDYYGQKEVESQCLSEHAQNYTWAMAMDADEFLWFSEKKKLKKFLATQTNYSYLSFGKWMYTLRYKIARTQSFFGGLNQHAFTARSYCYGNPGSPFCPTWVGRCKVMVRPNVHQVIGVHGDPEGKIGSKHFHTAVAHVKEWPFLLAYAMNQSEVRSNTSFRVSREQSDGLSMYWLHESHKANEDNTVTIHYDDELHDWFSFVSNN